jgi:hypothetical protein
MNWLLAMDGTKILFFISFVITLITAFYVIKLLTKKDNFKKKTSQ